VFIGKWVNHVKPKLGYPVHISDQDIISRTPVQILILRQISLRFFTDAGQGRDDDNASDEQSPPENQQQKDKKPKQKSGVTHDGGQQFEIKLAGVIGLRGMDKGHEFEMERYVKDAGIFNRIMYTLRCPEVQDSPATSTGQR
jgi:hypothetical protein